jgi:hypothetical protein
MTWCRAHARELRLAMAAAGLALLALMVRQAGVTRVVSSLAAIGPWFAPVVVVSAAWTVVNAWAWSLALLPARPRRAGLVRAVLAAEAVSNVTPLMSLGGEPLKVLLLKPAVGGEAAAASVVADNLVHAASAAVFMAVGLLSGGWAFALDRRVVAALVAGVGIAAAAAAYLLRASAGGLLAPFIRLAFRAVAPLASGEGAAADDRARRVDTTVRDFLRAGAWRVWVSLGLHLAGRLLGAVEAWIILAALGTPISLAGAVFVVAIAHVFVNLVFAFVPSQLGVQEAAAYLLFGAVGLDPAAAVALMLARRVRGFFWNGVGLLLLAGGPASSRPTSAFRPPPTS